MRAVLCARGAHIVNLCTANAHTITVLVLLPVRRVNLYTKSNLFSLSAPLCLAVCVLALIRSPNSCAALSCNHKHTAMCVCVCCECDSFSRSRLGQLKNMLRHMTMARKCPELPWRFESCELLVVRRFLLSFVSFA